MELKLIGWKRLLTPWRFSSAAACSLCSRGRTVSWLICVRSLMCATARGTRLTATARCRDAFASFGRAMRGVTASGSNRDAALFTGAPSVADTGLRAQNVFLFYNFIISKMRPPPIRAGSSPKPTIYEHELVLKFDEPSRELIAAHRECIKKLEGYLEKFPQYTQLNALYMDQLEFHREEYQFYCQVKQAHFRVRSSENTISTTCFD